ncbi:MAG: FHA domain-containing protein, partial [Planctomycetota bacterium]
MDVKLVVASGSLAGKAVTVKGPRFYIGRSEDCHLRPRSELVSRHHCAIILDGDYLAVRDFGSKNGTFVNGQRVRGECPLSDGDKLIVGVLEFVVKVEQPATKPKVESVQEAAARTAQAAQGDFDVDEWLTDEGTVGEDSPATAETKTIDVRVSETPEEVSTPTQEQQPQQELDEEKKKRIAALFSEDSSTDAAEEGPKPPKFQKPSAGNSRDAA